MGPVTVPVVGMHRVRFIETARILAVDLHHEFKDGIIWISEDAEFGEDLGECIEAALMSVWRFIKFTESRWLTVGTSLRKITAAILCGIDSLVGEIYKDKRASKFYLNGFKRLRGMHRQFAVRAALVSYVPESVQVELMRDSRVAIRYEHLWKVASTTLKW